MIDLTTLANTPLQVLLIGAVIYLFLELRKVTRSCEAKMEKLIERYHSTLQEGISIFTLIEQHLEDEK